MKYAVERDVDIGGADEKNGIICRHNDVVQMFTYKYEDLDVCSKW